MRVLLTTALTALCLGTALAPVVRAQTTVSLYAAPLVSGPAKIPAGTYDASFGVSVGGGIESSVVPTLGVGLDLALTATGSHYDGLAVDILPEFPPQRYTQWIRPLYLTAAPVVRLRLPSGRVRPYLVAGPIIALKLAERSGISGGPGDGLSSASDEYPDSPTGGTVGLGVEVPDAFALDALRVEVRASMLSGDRFTNQRTAEVRLGVVL